MICSVKYGSDWVTGLFIAGVKSLNLSSSLAHNNLIVIKSSWVIRAPSTNCLTWKNGQMFHSSTFRMGRVVVSTYCIQYVHYLILTMRPLTVFSLTAKFQASLPSMWLYSYNTITSSHPMPGLISAPWIRSSTHPLDMSAVITKVYSLRLLMPLFPSSEKLRTINRVTARLELHD